jgi:hypothetical protein
MQIVKTFSDENSSANPKDIKEINITAPGEFDLELYQGDILKIKRSKRNLVWHLLYPDFKVVGELSINITNADDGVLNYTIWYQ